MRCNCCRCCIGSIWRCRGSNFQGRLSSLRWCCCRPGLPSILFDRRSICRLECSLYRGLRLSRDLHSYRARRCRMSLLASSLHCSFDNLLKKCRYSNRWGIFHTDRRWSSVSCRSPGSCWDQSCCILRSRWSRLNSFECPRVEPSPSCIDPYHSFQGQKRHSVSRIRNRPSRFQGCQWPSRLQYSLACIR